MNNGLSYMQFPISKYDGFSGVETIIMHISGEWISSVLTLPLAKRDPQGAGSAITYARRYSLQSACGLPSEDDDGNAAQPSTTIKPTYQALQPQPKPIASKAAIIKAFEQSTTKEILQAKFDKAEGIAEYKGDSELLCAFNAQMTRLENV